MSIKTEQVYVPLVDEGLDVWRPTQAERLSDGSFRLLATPDYDEEDEKWQFPPGSRVVCEKKRISAGEVMAATKLAGANRRTA